jgi:hypothetical protein
MHAQFLELNTPNAPAFCLTRPRPYSSSPSIQLFLCLGARFLLSAITRVAAGAIPDFRAARRASVPTSIFFFFFRRLIDPS